MSSNPRAGAPVSIVNDEHLMQEQLLKGIPNVTFATDELELEDEELVEEQPNLGPLTNLQGDWTGKGFSMLTLPNNFQVNKTAEFQLKLNATMENTQFTPISAPIPNRGNTQEDIFFLGLTYMQKISDATTLEGIHVEPGILLYLPSNPVQTVASVVRLATIPHGDAVMAQGTFYTTDTLDPFPVADTTPFQLVDGKRVNVKSAGYLSAITNATPPAGINKDAIKNPNILLQEYVDNLKKEGKTIVSTTLFQVNATPVGGIEKVLDFKPVPDTTGGIHNIPFVVKNANANSLSAVFWIHIVRNADRSEYLVVQYSQTVILDFPVPGPGNTMLDIKWPHIAVATLIKR